MSVVTQVRARLAAYPRLAIWGVGGLGRNAYRYWLPVERIVLAIDANAKPGQMLGPLAVCRPEFGNLDGVDAVIICTSAYLGARSALRNLGFVGPTFYIYELFLPENGDRLNELRALAVDIAVTKNDIWPIFLLKKPQILVNITFRIGNWARVGGWKLPLYWQFYVLHHFVCLLLSIQLPLGTPIGPGLLFAHFGTIVFTKRAKIGSFFTIYHGCTVGTNDSGEGPIIGDFVYQYAGSHILGRCRIGDYSRVGANAVALNVECAPASTVVGMPARAIAHREENAS